jgi:hypothetical protein
LRALPAVLLAVTVAVLIASRASGAEVLVPAYFYPKNWIPGNDWARMTASVGAAPITAIMNPASGPGTAPNSDYVSAVAAFRAAGGTLVGYVYTNYTARPLADVEADIDRYFLWYAVDGIFLDQQANGAGDLAYYRTLYAYTRSRSATARLIANPGTAVPESFVSTPAADTEVTFESPCSHYWSATPPGWTSAYPSGRFSNIVYDVPDVATMWSCLSLAVSRNVGYVYFTDDTLNNPYDRLPTYWDTEVAAVAAVPEPGALFCLLSGTLIPLLFRRR